MLFMINLRRLRSWSVCSSYHQPISLSSVQSAGAQCICCTRLTLALAVLVLLASTLYHFVFYISNSLLLMSILFHRYPEARSEKHGSTKRRTPAEVPGSSQPVAPRLLRPCNHWSECQVKPRTMQSLELWYVYGGIRYTVYQLPLDN